MAESATPPSKFQAGYAASGAVPAAAGGVHHSPRARLNPLAVTSFVIALFVGVLAPVTVVTGLVARAQIRRSGAAGAGLATASVMISAVYLVAGVVVAALHFFVTGS
jgi:hypothetical protein